MSTELQPVSWDASMCDYQRKLGNFVQYFQINLPTNSYGVPLKLLDPTLLAPHIVDCDTTDDVPDDIVTNAILHIDFDEGIPVLEGTPLWERFDGEQIGYYKAFKTYRDMLYSTGTRSIAKLSAQTTVQGKILNILSKVYHWSLRCKAYDAYKKAEAAKIRYFEIEKMESKHAKAANSLIDKALKYLDDHPEQINPKIALQMLQLGMKASRLSLGLNPDKPGSTDSAPSISIHQSSNGGEVTTSVQLGEGNSGSKEPDMGYLQSIVHILDKSGALDQAKREVIEADFTEVVDANSEAVEGA